MLSMLLTHFLRTHANKTTMATLAYTDVDIANFHYKEPTKNKNGGGTAPCVPCTVRL